jgi:hypothetical protein
VLTTTELLERLTDEYQKVCDRVISGQCRDWSDYRAQCARIRQLEDVQDIATGRDKKTPEVYEDK